MKFLASLATIAALLPMTAAAETFPPATLYKNPGCECCDGHAAYLRRYGMQIRAVEAKDMHAMKAKAGIPEQLEGCHTIVIGNYVVEGHVPISAIKLLLDERPAIRGISLPGMPNGSPGMSGRKTETFVTYSFGESGIQAFDIE